MNTAATSTPGATQAIVPGTESHFGTTTTQPVVGDGATEKKPRKPRKPSKKIREMLEAEFNRGVSHGLNMDTGKRPLWLPLLTLAIGAAIGKWLL